MSDSESKRCQLCGHQPLKRFEIPRQNIFWKCFKCDLYQYGALDSQSALDSPAYHQNSERQRGRKVRTAAVRLNRIAPLIPGRTPRMLDIGCGIGAVLEAAQQRGWVPVGAEVSRPVVNDCRERGFECELIANGRLPFDDGSFDVATAWSVIEHVEDVRVTLADWRRVLRPGGILALDTTDAHYWKARLFGARYRGFWPGGHTYTFTPDNLGQFLTETGFRLLRRPLVGRLSDLPLPLACYTLGYQLQYEFRCLTRSQKPFMLFAERVETVGNRLRRAA